MLRILFKRLQSFSDHRQVPISTRSASFLTSTVFTHICKYTEKQFSWHDVWMKIEPMKGPKWCQSNLLSSLASQNIILKYFIFSIFLCFLISLYVIYMSGRGKLYDRQLELQINQKLSKNVNSMSEQGIYWLLYAVVLFLVEYFHLSAAAETTTTWEHLEFCWSFHQQ